MFPAVAVAAAGDGGSGGGMKKMIWKLERKIVLEICTYIETFDQSLRNISVNNELCIVIYKTHSWLDSAGSSTTAAVAAAAAAAQFHFFYGSLRKSNKNTTGIKNRQAL